MTDREIMQALLDGKAVHNPEDEVYFMLDNKDTVNVCRKANDSLVGFSTGEDLFYETAEIYERDNTKDELKSKVTALEKEVAKLRAVIDRSMNEFDKNEWKWEDNPL